MSIKRDEIEGDLIINRIPKELCWGKPEDFVKQLTQILGVNILTNPGNELVVVGHQVPANQDKGKLWIRLSRSGIFQGFFLFQGRKWTRIHNYRSDEVIWMYGDSRNIPEGFQLIDSNTGGVTTDVREHLIKQYLVAGTDPVSQVDYYSYYATRYIGTT